MRMDPDRHGQQVRVPGGKLEGRPGRGPVPARDEDPGHTRRPRAVQHGVEVVDEDLVLEMGVGVDDPS